jgi:hypothetical protein
MVRRVRLGESIDAGPARHAAIAALEIPRARAGDDDLRALEERSLIEHHVMGEVRWHF